MTAIAAPDQRMTALDHANVIRVARAKLKRELKAGRRSIFDVLLEPPAYAETMKVVDVLLAHRKYGRVKVTKTLQRCRISPSKTLGGISQRQRAELLSMLRSSGTAAPVPARPAGGVIPDSQHMRALRHANDIRLARAALKREIAAGETSVCDVLRDRPSEAESMTIAALLMSQHRWGRTRMRRFVAALPMLETKTLESMTDRQRGEIIQGLTPAPALSEVTVVASDFSERLHLCAGGFYTVCGKETDSRYRATNVAEWDSAHALRCITCARHVDGQVLHDA